MTQKPPILGLTLALSLASAACSIPRYYAPHPCDRPDLTGCVIENVSVSGSTKVPQGDVKDNIATTESGHVLGGALKDIPILSVWDRITVDYEQLDPFVLERDLARVERLYRARGYYEAHARAARVQKTGKERVRVEIVVEEGEPVLVGEVRTEWKGKKPVAKVQTIVTRRETRRLPKDAPFAEQAFEETKKRLLRALTDNGYAYATIEGKATVDLVKHRADVVYTADAGPRTTFGPIRIEGAGTLPLDRLRQAIDINEGETFSTAKLESAQGALANLRVLGSIDVAPELSKDGEVRVTAVPVVFRLSQTTLKTAKMGGGVELGTRAEVHGVAGWENRNFLGGLRSFTVEAKPGVVFFPVTLTTLFNGTPVGFKIVPEMRLHTALTQPGFLESRTRGTISADFNVYQLVPTSTLGYLEVATKAGVSRDFWDGKVQLSFSTSMQYDQPLRLQLPGACSISTARGYNRLIIPYVQSVATLDLRYGHGNNPKRDPINPHRGFYLSNDVQVAFGDSRDVRVRPEMRGYIPIGKQVTLALRVAGGFLYTFGGDLSEVPYDQFDTTPDPECPTEGASMCQTEGLTCMSDAQCCSGSCMDTKCTKPPRVPSNATVSRNRWVQVLQLRGFYSGGTNSNRGYAYNGVGPQERVPGISPETSPGTFLPIATGGQALWEASVELRFPVYEKIGMTLFLDGSDLRRSIAEFAAPFAPHLSTGIGLRYLTPVGPLRVDFGVRIPGAQVIGGSCATYDPSVAPSALPVGPKVICDPTTGFLNPIYGQAGSIRGVVPLALSLAIGESF